MKSNIQQLNSRGYIENKDIEKYNDFSRNQLIELLEANEPIKRTIAVIHLGKFKDVDILDLLISKLTIEKKLYTKIALSETIANYGEKASDKLIIYLGIVGNNQHIKMPDKPFNKTSYPLPRDIIARTLVKIGKPALTSLKKCICNGAYNQVLEAVDAIGFISFYTKDISALQDILNLLNQYRNDELMVWKIIRALQSFRDEAVESILKFYSQSNIKQHKLEAKRSFAQIKKEIKTTQ